jgi:hypothetical protein
VNFRRALHACADVGGRTMARPLRRFEEPSTQDSNMTMRFPALPLLAATWIWLASPQLSAAQAAPVQDGVTQVLIPLELLANRPLVRAMVNGQGPVPFLIVPDARRTLIDPELGEALKIHRQGNAAPEASVELAFPKHTIKTSATVEDISRYVAEFPAAVRPRGVLSLSAFGDQLVTLDYPRWKVSIEPGALEEPNGKNVFPLTDTLELRLPLVIADQSIDCVVDPLFPSDLYVPASALVGDAPRLARDIGVMRTPAGLRRVREVRLATTATLGPFQLKTPLLLVTDAADGARIGAPWLGRYEVTYDVAHERVRIGRASAVMARQ